MDLQERSTVRIIFICITTLDNERRLYEANLKACRNNAAVHWRSTVAIRDDSTVEVPAPGEALERAFGDEVSNTVDTRLKQPSTLIVIEQFIIGSSTNFRIQDRTISLQQLRLTIPRITLIPQPRIRLRVLELGSTIRVITTVVLIVFAWIKDDVHRIVGRWLVPEVQLFEYTE